MRSPTRRVNSGRGHRYFVDEIERPGATTIISNGFPKPALLKWSAEATARYAVNHWDELAETPVAQRLETLFRARFLERDSAGERGTDVHLLVHRLAAGEQVEVPEPLDPFVDAYEAFVRDWQPRELLIEAMVVNRTLRYCGTLDAVADLIDAQRWLLDFKTAAKGVFDETALQLAAYRYAESVIVDGEESPMPAVDQVGAVWLRADGTYELLPVDAGPGSFRIFGDCIEIANWREREDPIGSALTPLRREEVAP